MKLSIQILFFALCIGGISLTGCGTIGDDGSTPSSAAASRAAVAIQRVVISPSDQTMFLGDLQRFTATAYYADGTSADVTSQVTWASGNASVAPLTLSLQDFSDEAQQTKVVTVQTTDGATSPGITHISATASAQSGSVAASATLTIYQLQTMSFPVSGNPAANTIGTADGAVPIIVNGTFYNGSTSTVVDLSDGYPQNLTWTSSNNAKATVSSVGGKPYVTGIAAGAVTLTANAVYAAGSTNAGSPVLYNGLAVTQTYNLTVSAGTVGGGGGGSGGAISGFEVALLALFLLASVVRKRLGRVA